MGIWKGCIGCPGGVDPSSQNKLRNSDNRERHAMTGRLWVLAATVAVLAVGRGCVRWRRTAYQEALSPPDEMPYPPPVRNQVFLFMMNGHDVLEYGGMLGLRDQLCHAGHPIVCYAQRTDREWYRREMWRGGGGQTGARAT